MVTDSIIPAIKAIATKFSFELNAMDDSGKSVVLDSRNFRQVDVYMSEVLQRES